MSAADTAVTRRGSKDIEATIRYAGDILGRARFDLVDPSRMNMAFHEARMPVRDARDHPEVQDFSKTGFSFVKHPSSLAVDPDLFESNRTERHTVTSGASAAYEAEVAAFLKDITGARDVFPQMGGLVARTSDRATRKSWAGVATFVHLDFTARSTHQFLNWSLAAQGRTIAPYRRMVVYQTWRALTAGPQDSTLAVCDGSSVPAADAVLYDAIFGPSDRPGAQFESRLCKYRSTHDWYYMSDLEPDDLLLLCGFDSDAPSAMNAMHTAIDNPLATEGEPRRSLEARFFALFD